MNEKWGFFSNGRQGFGEFSLQTRLGVFQEQNIIVRRKLKMFKSIKEGEK